MLKIGIIGAENSHCTAIARLCNRDKKVDARAEYVWGETDEFAQKAAQDGEIPNIVKDWREMFGKVDGVMIDHRHAKLHYAPAEFFLKKGVPVFVDKPFTFTLAEGKKLCALARRKKVPLTTFSIIPMQQNFADFKKAVAEQGPVIGLNTFGPVDLKSQHGGVFFYGIHQVDAVIDLLGPNVQSAQLLRHGDHGIAFLEYKDGPMVTINCIKTTKGFHWVAVTEKEVVTWHNQNDTSPYLTGLRTFLAMFANKEDPFSHQRMLAPVAVLEALAKSLKTGQKVKVAKV